MGTPEPAVPTLERLAARADDVIVCTQPDRPQGRSGSPQPPPVKQAANALGLRVLQPADRRELSEAVRSLRPLDVGVVVAYGMILDEETLEIPARGFLNVHFSLLPRWRGAAPVERAMLAGDANTGVTIMHMDAGLDTGPTVATTATHIREEETAGALTERLAVAGAQLLDGVLEDWVNGMIKATPQDDDLRTYASRLSAEEARLDFTLSAAELGRRIRAFNPRPGAWAIHDDRIKIWSARGATEGQLEPGLVEAHEDRVVVGTGEGVLVLGEVQPSGRTSMPATDWVRGVKSRPIRLR